MIALCIIVPILILWIWMVRSNTRRIASKKYSYDHALEKLKKSINSYWTLVELGDSANYADYHFKMVYNTRNAQKYNTEMYLADEIDKPEYFKNKQEIEALGTGVREHYTNFRHG